MTYRFVRWSLVAGFVAASLQAQVPASQPTVRPVRRADGAQNVYNYNVQATDVDSILSTLEDLTGRTVIRPQALPPATYTIKLVNKTKEEVITALETELEVNNVAILPLGEKFLEVVPLAIARTAAPEFINGTSLNLPASGQIATKLFQLQFLKAAEFFSPQLITALFSPNTGGGVVVLEKANAALVTDTVANIQRTERLVTAIDQPTVAGLVPKFYPLHNAQATTLVTKLRAILTGPIASGIGTNTAFQPDDRTNQVILLADPRQYPLFDDLINKLDIASDPNTHTEVIYLKNADAATLATELGTLVTGQAAQTQKAAAASQSVRPGENGYASTGTINNPLNASAPFIGSAPPAPVNPVAQAIQTARAQVGGGGAANGGESANNEFSSLITTLADERSNAIIVSGTADDIRLMHELIDKLDVVLPQVRIEVVIAEVTLDDTNQSGLNALGLTVATDNIRGTHVSNFTGSIPGWDVTSGVVNPLAFQAALNTTSAGGKSLVKIVQADVITTTHNKQGEVIVGESDPIINGTTSTPSATATGAPTTTSTVQYEQIGLDLKVTPLIGDNGNVQLTIDQKVDTITGTTTINGNSQPIIGNRETTSFVSVQDGQMIVLGGLQQTQKSSTQNKLGLLYEIPIISQIFGGHTDELTRTELLLFVRPHIIKPENGTAETKAEINGLGNKEDVIKYLANPADKQNNAKVQNFLNRFQSDGKE